MNSRQTKIMPEGNKHRKKQPYSQGVKVGIEKGRMDRTVNNYLIGIYHMNMPGLVLSSGERIARRQIRILVSCPSL